MKKIFVLVMVMVATATRVFAYDQNEFNVFSKLNDKSTFKSLVRYLEVNIDQADQLKQVFTVTENEMKSAIKADNDAKAENVLLYNLKNTRIILSEDQYRKYLTALNVTIDNANEMNSK